MSGHFLDRWFTERNADIGRHRLSLLAEVDGARGEVMDELRQAVRGHYVAPAVAASWIADHGAPQTAELLRELLPTAKRARSGDLGEILATEVAEHYLDFDVPIRRLRWKDGRDMALRGDDIVGLSHRLDAKLRFLKGESKSRAELATAVLDEAGQALDRNKGRPTPHSVLFVASCLRQQGEDDLAREIEEAVLNGFRGRTIEHLVFVLTGSNPENLLTLHLETCEDKQRRRHAVGLRIGDHSKFISELFEGL